MYFMIQVIDRFKLRAKAASKKEGPKKIELPEKKQSFSK